jgi:hypothetical protein
MEKDEFHQSLERLSMGRPDPFNSRQRTIDRLLAEIDQHKDDWFTGDGYEKIKEILHRWKESMH